MLFVDAIEFLVDEVNEKVHVDLGSPEHLHHCQPFILQLQQVLCTEKQTTQAWSHGPQHKQFLKVKRIVCHVSLHHVH